MYSPLQNLIRVYSERIYDFDLHVKASLAHYILSIPEFEVRKNSKRKKK